MQKNLNNLLKNDTFYVFVLSVGRSGTKSLASAISFLEHEEDGSQPSISKFLERSKGKKIYGSTSHFWKSYLSELKEEFPNALYIHLVRDPIKVIESLKSKGWYKGKQKKGYEYREEILPVLGFKKMSRFEKLCWYWRYWNMEIDKHADLRIRLEDISRFLPKLNESKRKKNNYPNWSQAEWYNFWIICGKLAKEYGYYYKYD